MELDTFQLFLIGLAASLLAQGIKLIAARLGKKVPRLYITIVVLVISLGLAVIFMKPALPPAGDPGFIEALVSLVMSVVGAAMVIYNVLLAAVLDKLSLSASKVLARYHGEG